jgi:hypothetical protein
MGLAQFSDHAFDPWRKLGVAALLCDAELLLEQRQGHGCQMLAEIGAGVRLRGDPVQNVEDLLCRGARRGNLESFRVAEFRDDLADGLDASRRGGQRGGSRLLKNDMRPVVRGIDRHLLHAP